MIDKAITLPVIALPATPPELVSALTMFEGDLVGKEPAELATQHVIHAGMYARTVALEAGQVITGALVKRATLVIVCGSAAVLTDCGTWRRLDGYNVLAAAKGRKQVFAAFSTVMITMLFPTAARTVEEAEREFTDDADRLLSRRQNANTVLITED